MDQIRALLIQWGLIKAPETRTPDQIIADLKVQAEAAEKRAEQTAEAWELKKRIAAANVKRQNVIIQANNGKKPGLNKLQLYIIGGGVVALFLLFFVKC